ncbi:MAG: DUF2336 domain-containing protein [Pseudolabrys sp.]
MVERSLLAEIESSLSNGSSDQQVEILRRVTDLFMAGAAQYSDEQIDLFDSVISCLAATIELKARAELAARLAPVENAPPTAVRRLANDASMEVAGPILTQSARLTDEDLREIAENKSQEHLLAISKRAALSENVSDALVARGNRDVVLSVTRNEGARFSDAGYGSLVAKSMDDEVLAICVGLRKDIPRPHFQALIAKASEVVLQKLAADHPLKAIEVQKVLASITGQPVTMTAKPQDDGKLAAEFESVRRSGLSADAVVRDFAAKGKFAETVEALSALSRTPRDLVESIMSDRRGENDFALLLAKAAGLSWPTAMQICILRRGPGNIPAMALDAARRNYEKIQTETAKRVVGFYNQRRTALSNFENLAQNISGAA